MVFPRLMPAQEASNRLVGVSAAVAAIQQDSAGCGDCGFFLDPLAHFKPGSGIRGSMALLTSLPR